MIKIDSLHSNNYKLKINNQMKKWKMKMIHYNNKINTHFKNRKKVRY